MLITIYLETESGQHIYRKYNWEVDGNYEEKGKVVESMLEVLSDDKVTF